eukprot:3064288-Pleurochrysis_carterae.AAC.1
MSTMHIWSSPSGASKYANYAYLELTIGCFKICKSSLSPRVAFLPLCACGCHDRTRPPALVLRRGWGAGIGSRMWRCQHLSLAESFVKSRADEGRDRRTSTLNSLT